MTNRNNQLNGQINCGDDFESSIWDYIEKSTKVTILWIDTSNIQISALGSIIEGLWPHSEPFFQKAMVGATPTLTFWLRMMSYRLYFEPGYSYEDTTAANLFNWAALSCGCDL